MLVLYFYLVYNAVSDLAAYDVASTGEVCERCVFTDKVAVHVEYADGCFFEDVCGWCCQTCRPAVIGVASRRYAGAACRVA